MLRRILAEESGMAMGLAIVTMVLVGVLGAGLLTFVMTDLRAVTEVNQGQRALDMADAGAQAAKRHLYSSDTTREHYDWTHTNDCEPSGRRLVNEDWSPATTVFANADCSGAATARTTPGVTRNFAGGSFNVVISCYRQKGETATSSPCQGAPAGAAGTAPEDIEANRRAYFKVTSIGCFPVDCSGARRKVEAIYYAGVASVPTAYYAKENIAFSGSPTVNGVSFFARRNIALGNSRPNRNDPVLFGDWDTRKFDPPSNLNTQPRQRTPEGGEVAVEGVGFAAGRIICSGSNPENSNCGSSVADGVNDYDSTTATTGSRKKFERKTDVNAPNPTGIISYPFNPDASFDLDVLRREAQRQGNYYASHVNITNTNYPPNSTGRTVFFVDSNSTSSVSYSVSHNPTAQGLIVVNNGVFDMSGNRDFNGIVIVTGNGSATGNYKNTGNGSLGGFAVADGTIEIKGNVNPSTGRNFTNVPGFYGISLWSWREVYE
jgi:Tfp pilus assembly protein PilX